MTTPPHNNDARRPVTPSTLLKSITFSAFRRFRLNAA
jgi:hypothetical protein